MSKKAQPKKNPKVKKTKKLTQSQLSKYLSKEDKKYDENFKRMIKHTDKFAKALWLYKAPIIEAESNDPRVLEGLKKLEQLAIEESKLIKL